MAAVSLVKFIVDSSDDQWSCIIRSLGGDLGSSGWWHMCWWCIEQVHCKADIFSMVQL